MRESNFIWSRIVDAVRQYPDIQFRVGDGYVEMLLYAGNGAGVIKRVAWEVVRHATINPLEQAGRDMQYEAAHR